MDWGCGMSGEGGEDQSFFFFPSIFSSLEFYTQHQSRPPPTLFETMAAPRWVAWMSL